MFAALTDLVLPRTCAGCRRPDRDGLCAGCGPGPAPPVSGALGFPLAAAADYTGGVRSALIAYKERGRRDLAPALARLLADAVAAAEAAAELTRPGILVPVPSSRAARRARGGEHVLRLARRVRSRPVRNPLRLTRSVRDSAGLDTAARAANLTGAFVAVAADRVAGRVADRPVIVVDDIATTGATLAEAARALAAAGWSVAGAAVVAVTPKRVGRDRWQDPVDRSSVRLT